MKNFSFPTLLLLCLLGAGCGKTYMLTGAEPQAEEQKTDAVGNMFQNDNDVSVQSQSTMATKTQIAPVNLDDYKGNAYRYHTIPGTKLSFYTPHDWSLIERGDHYALVKMVEQHTMSVVITLIQTNDTLEQVILEKFNQPEGVDIQDTLEPNFADMVRTTIIDAGPYGAHVYAMRFGNAVVKIEAVNGPGGDPTIRDAERILVNTLKENNP